MSEDKDEDGARNEDELENDAKHEPEAKHKNENMDEPEAISMNTRLTNKRDREGVRINMRLTIMRIMRIKMRVGVERVSRKTKSERDHAPNE